MTAPTAPRIGRYPITSEVGRGGTGVVYRGRHPGLDRSVAIKLLVGWSERSVQRLLREGSAMSRLRHPSIVPLHEVSQHEGQPYLVLDFVEGESLEARLEQGPLAPGRAAEVVRDLARAVGYAHSQGILHRDLKPGNVLLRPDGQVLLTDFGLAKDLDAPVDGLSVSGVALGTPGYWPPEQARGDLAAVDARSDVYGLGGILYAALTGRPPFESGSLAEAMIAACEQPPTPPSEVRPGLDPALNAVCLRALAKEPRERFATANELASALDEVLAPTATPAPIDWRRVAFAGALLGAVVLAAAAVAVRRSRAAAERQAARASAEPDGATWIARGLARYSRGERDAARRCFRAAAAADPADGTAYYCQGLIAKDEEAWAQADELLTRAIELGLSHAQGYLQRGFVRYQRGALRGALADWDAYVAAAPGDVMGYLGRGSTRQRVGDLKGSLADFDRALELNPEESTALVSRAWVRHQLGLERQAIEDCDRALAVGEQRADALFHRGVAYHSLGELKRAERDLDQALRLEQKNPQMWLARGIVRGDREDWRGAFEDFDRAVGLDPRLGVAYMNRGSVRARLGDLNGALADYRRARELPHASLDPEVVEASIRRTLARLREMQGGAR